MITEALVTVGGKGSRLRKAGLRFPCTKSFIEVLGEPIIFWNLKNFERGGFRRVVFCADNVEAIDNLKTLINRMGKTDITFSFFLDDGLGTAGLPFHFRRQFSSAFFFITGHSFVSARHFDAMREVAERNTVTVSTYMEQKTARNIRTNSFGYSSHEDQSLSALCRMVDYPYVVDDTYCERIAANNFNVFSTLREFYHDKAINFIDSEMPVEIDEPEQFEINLKAIEASILESDLP
ncbi:MAG: hypothetical protein ABIS51_03510 [Sphingomonas sp.]